MATSLPTQAFDGQVFIDAFRIKWEFDGSVRCWKKVGTVPDIPVVTEFQPGLLPARLKSLLDGIPTNGGHFGIIAKPLLSLVPQNPTQLYNGTVRRAIRTESGTQLTPVLEERELAADQFLGKVLIFKSGTLTKRAFLIFGNTAEVIHLEGDATEAQKGDAFQVADMAELNPSGILLGDIMLVSDSIDISCVDGDGIPLKTGCNMDAIPADGVDPPGLNLQLSQEFLDNFCVTLPGCKGPKGIRGEKGPVGADGTGDGPQGETGDAGEDAPIVANTFTGIKIIDIDDVYDTAVVSMELDAANGKLNVIRAKVRTPDDKTPATQVVSTPIDRGLRFTNDDTFDYEILMPPVDAIGVADIDLLKYPRKFDKGQAGVETQIHRLKLSTLLDKMVAVFDERLSDINDQYNQQLKQFIEAKDESARQILANLAHQLSECEWELPIEFCLGISPSDCHPGDGNGAEAQTRFEYPLTGVLFGSTGGGPGTAIDLGTYTVMPRAEDNQLSAPSVSVKFPHVDNPISTITLPPGNYIIQYLSGSIKSSATDWMVGSLDEGEGLCAFIRNGGDPEVLMQMPIPAADFNAKEQASVELAYQEAPVMEKVITVEITDENGGSIYLSAPLSGLKPAGRINVKVLKVDPS